MAESLIRCTTCARMTTTLRINKKTGACPCGGRRFCGASPAGFKEKIVVFMWELQNWIRRKS